MGYLNPDPFSRAADLHGLFAATWLGTLQADSSRASLEREVAEKERQARETLVTFQKLTDGYFVMLEVRLRGGDGEEDIDKEIDFLQTLERSTLPRELRTFDRNIQRRKKLLAERRDLHALVDQIAASVHGYAANLQSICRDARWRLMALRAEHQPSAPAGPIQGEATDLDAYLKSLG
jgi:hypothetical protein